MKKETVKIGSRTYKTVKIGNQTWMAENLSCRSKGSKAYGNDSLNENKYGRLYDWASAAKLAPKGWHLPSKDEMLKMLNTERGLLRLGVLPGGGWCQKLGFRSEGDFAFLWSGDDLSRHKVDAATYMVVKEVFENRHNISIAHGYKSNMFSVRYVKD